jgi:Zn finger protein HypA/HybF involved in hydrogenase expression
MIVSLIFSIIDVCIYVYFLLKLTSKFNKNTFLILIFLTNYKIFGMFFAIYITILNITIENYIYVPVITFMIYNKLKTKSFIKIIIKYLSNHNVIKIKNIILNIGDKVCYLFQILIKSFVNNFKISSKQKMNIQKKSNDVEIDDKEFTKLNAELDSILNIGINIVENISKGEKKDSQKENVNKFMEAFNSIFIAKK